MNIEQSRQLDEVSVYRYRSKEVIKKGNIKCQKCKILYDQSSEVAKFTCGYTCHVACLQNMIADVKLLVASVPKVSKYYQYSQYQ